MYYDGRGLYQSPALVKMNYPYIYTWGNNPKRLTLKGRKCRVIARGSLNSVGVEFENGQREVISRYALRRVK